MLKEEKRVLTLDRYEHGVVTNTLNEMRNDLICEDRSTDIVDEVLLKTIDAPYHPLLSDLAEGYQQSKRSF